MLCRKSKMALFKWKNWICLKQLIMTIICLYRSVESWNIRQTKCLEKYKATGYTEITLNHTHPGKQIICKVWTLQDFPHNLTVCNGSYRNSIDVDTILHLLPKHTECIQINVENLWHGYLPLDSFPINISAATRFPNLTCLILQARYGYYYQLYPLVGKPNLFQHLNKMKILSFTIPLEDAQDASIPQILGNISVECLDFTNIRGMTLPSLTDVMKNANHEALQYFYVKTFQYSGRDDYASHLNFLQITNKTQVFSNLKAIDISSNDLSRITPGITKLAPHLEWLDVSENILIDSHNFAFLSEVLTSDSLKYLNYDYQGNPYHSGTKLINETVSNLMTHINNEPSERNTGGNYSIGELNVGDEDGSSMEAKQLQFVFGCINIVAQGNVSTIAQSSTVFCQFLRCILPPYFEDNNCNDWPIYPQFNTFFDFQCMFYIKFPIGRKLKSFFFSYIHFEKAQTLGVIFKGTFCMRANSLNTVYIDGNGPWAKAVKLGKTVRNLKGFVGFENITTLSVRDSEVKVNQYELEENSFTNSLKKLEYLDLSGNSFVFRNTFELCRDAPMVREVILRNINITRLPPNIIKNCSMLKSVKIGNNSLISAGLNDLDLDGTNLSFIELTSTGLDYLDQRFTKQMDKYPAVVLDLSNNPLSCNCSTKPKTFVKWMILNQHRLRGYGTYSCFGPGGVTFVNKIQVDQFWQSCTSNTWATVIKSILGTLFAVAVLSSFGMIYRWRWRLKYYWYRFIQICYFRCGHINLDEKETVMWKYDAFISYCADDRFWVHSTLMKTLEDVYGFHLCIHLRDFPLGGDIGETICESMTHSREIILVLSDFALRSGWCHFELTEALAQIDRRNKKLFVIKLGTLEKYLLDPKVNHLLENHTYLEWSENKESHKLFWAKLVGSLYDDPQGTCLCCPYGARALGYHDIRDPQLDGNSTDAAEGYGTFGFVNRGITQAPEGNDVSRERQELLNLTQNCKEKATKAENFLSYMESEELPCWAYGPLPRKLENLLDGKDGMLKEQLNRYAGRRVRLIKQCLQDFLEEQKNKCLELEGQLEDIE